MSDDTNPDPQPDEGKGEGKQEQTFTQADVDRIVRERVQRERAKYADYDDLKAKAGEKAPLEERVAAMEKRALKAEADALRATYAADIPEKLRPLLTGSTDEELKAQRDLLVEAESERQKNGNHVPTEGTNPQSGPDDKSAFANFLTGH